MSTWKKIAWSLVGVAVMCIAAVWAGIQYQEDAILGIPCQYFLYTLFLCFAVVLGGEKAWRWRKALRDRTFERIEEANQRFNAHLKREGLNLWGSGIGLENRKFFLKVNFYDESEQKFERERVRVPVCWEGFDVRLERVGHAVFL